MMKEYKTHRKIYLDIVVVLAVTVFFAVFFTWKFQDSSKQTVLNTLSEISDQSVSVIQEEVSKNKMLLVNLAIYMSQDETKDIDILISKLKEVDRNNGFKRMGIVREDGFSRATDGMEFMVDETDVYERFQPAINGETVVSDRLGDLADGEDVTLYSTPINWSDGTRYVLFGNYAIKDYRKILSVSTFGGSGYSYIVKANGDCVIDTDNSNGQGFENYLDLAQSQSEKNADEVEQMQSDFSNGKEGFVSLEMEKGERYIYYQPLDVNDWYLLSVIPQNVVEKQINASMFLAYAILLVFIIGITYLAFRIYRIQIRNKQILERAAYVDEVTGDASYARFRKDALGLLSKYKEKKYAVVALNIQRFQYINDLYGYEEGDKILKQVMVMLKRKIGDHECAARVQADHFAALLTYHDQEKLEKRIEGIVEYIQDEADNRKGDTPYVLKIQAGVYLAERREELPETMQDRAFTAIRSEYNTEMRVCNFYNDMIRSQMLKNQEIEESFQDALRNREFFVCYQPKFSVQEKKFCGAEALVRWKELGKGIINPNEFIPVLERCGGIIELDEYVLDMTCCQMRKWLDEGITVLPVSVNVSQLHLYQLDFVERYVKIIDKYSIPHELIQLEMTETALFGNEDILSESLENLRGHGIKILMDDFGSGYSSVMMLKSMPIDILKIDKNMIDPVKQNEKVRQILECIIGLTKSMKLEAIAEGVESKAQYDILKEMGVHSIQGYYCAKPMGVEEYTHILLESETTYEY